MSENLEPVFIASNVREADLVERVLQSAGVEFKQRLEGTLRETSEVCYLGTLFEVSPNDADRCRTLLKEKGLGSGLVPAT
jgi:hypothetical protein